MKAIVVRQPWASLIASGEKRVENRSWRTSYRGPLLIVAGRAGNGTLPRGVAVAVVNLIDIRAAALTHDHYAAGPHCWIFDTPHPITSFAVAGKLGIFDVDFAPTYSNATVQRPVDVRHVSNPVPRF